jgi:hypothetical protein
MAVAPWNTEPYKEPGFRKKFPPFTEEEISTIVDSYINGGRSINSLAKETGRTSAAIRRVISNASKIDGDMSSVHSEGKVQSYLANIQWAMQACGEYLRTKTHPKTCPNDTAWFLFVQAKEEPKDFMAKASAAEAKNTDGESDKDVRASCKRSITEIEKFLKKIEEAEDEKIDNSEGSEKK